LKTKRQARLRYDVVYWWDPRRSIWIEYALLEGEKVREVAADFEGEGFVANVGSTSIGPPEGPPKPERFRGLVK
jgi:hypothetical protein